MESSAAMWPTMTGMDTGPVPTRHPTLFVGQRSPTEIMGVVEDGDPPCAACDRDDVEGLIELHHFFVGVCFRVHRASKT